MGFIKAFTGALGGTFADQWKDYLYMTDMINSDDQTKESIVKITLYKVLMQRESIKAIKRGANL